jgi:hypothetical protein
LKLPATRVFPSGDHARHWTRSSFRGNETTAFRVATSQSPTRPSRPPLANRLPSGEKSRQRIGES